LQQEFRRAVGRCTAVDEHGLSAGLRRNLRGHGRAADALDAPDSQRGRREQRAGRARRDERISAALLQHIQAHDHAGILFLFYNRRRIIVHIHDVVRVGNLHALGKRFDALILQRAQDGLAASDQHDLAVEVLCCLDRAQRNLIRGVIAAHGVYQNSHVASSCPVI